MIFVYALALYVVVAYRHWIVDGVQSVAQKFTPKDDLELKDYDGMLDDQQPTKKPHLWRVK